MHEGKFYLLLSVCFLEKMFNLFSFAIRSLLSAREKGESEFRMWEKKPEKILFHCNDFTVNVSLSTTHNIHVITLAHRLH